jgi:hypothetical protein
LLPSGSMLFFIRASRRPYWFAFELSMPLSVLISVEL